MDLNVNKLRSSVRRLLPELAASHNLSVESKSLKKFLELKTYNSKNVESLIECLGRVLLHEDYTEMVALLFDYCLLPILANTMPCDVDNDNGSSEYLRKCAALAKLIPISPDASRHARIYFRTKPSPFELDNVQKIKKLKVDDVAWRAAMVRCCYRLLAADASYFKNAWDWSVFLKDYMCKPDETELNRLFMNHIFAILSNMSSSQLQTLNANIKPETVLRFHQEQQQKFLLNTDEANEDVQAPVNLEYLSNRIANVEGVYLPIFRNSNVTKLEKSNDLYTKIVKVDSTKVNLRSIALGVASGKAICLSGPVGCGKTTLVEYLARVTGRVAPKSKSRQEDKENNKLGCSGALNQADELNLGGKRKLARDGLDRADDVAKIGFLRIQLGDQTDSKMLLGQYHCSDVPGEFIWSPGVLTQAVMNGAWLLLEDLDAATQDTYTILSSLLENKFLNVPGYRDRINIEPGFQLFMTVRSLKSSSNSSRKSLFSLLEKYLYTVNILPLSRNELCKVVSTNYPKLATVANRIVDVFLTFSSGDHSMADNLRDQETGDKADTTEKFTALPFDEISIASIPNAGRLVSTRDLIKLCERSNPMFSVTSTECAYFVLQNAVDVFCSYLPQGVEKTKFITSIGAKLGIIQSRCEFLANEYKPEVSVDPASIKVGRATLLTKATWNVDADDNTTADIVPMKRRKLNETNAKSTFSFTRMATCVLERIAMCVSQGEPVLLVGETGVGKTSSVQYLAERTDHKLVVVNMNNQSDVSDLIGGFKPVDISYVLKSLRSKFEELFGNTFHRSKNEVFLTKLSVCFNEKKYNIAIQTMLTVSNSVLKRKSDETMSSEVARLLPLWREMNGQLSKIKSQLAKSLNISFAFIPGSLVNCITNGDWVLLDEINLASAETLECLSTILEPDGSIVLLEKGDYTPVTRHPEFRIFACMNPNTDIGKKDLPVGIRNRFTEFFVDELTTDADLSLLVSDYLASTGIQKKSVVSIVKLFKKLKQLSKLELNDGLGNRPVFSLRTLCRSLRICAKNLCGSIERNLYESFCMSFLTQLDTASHQIVLYLIKGALLSNEKAVLKQGIPKPGENYLNFEGYWIQQGPQPIQECLNYILTESIRENLRDVARIISIGKLPVLLQGPTSAGKTSLIEYVAKRSGNQCLRINNHEHTDLQEYIGTYAADVTGKLSFVEGVLVQAMRNGYWIILDELNLASTDILEALNRVLDDNRELFIPETQTVVKAHPNFMLFATQNPPGLYGGRKTLSRAFKNRFIELHFSEIPRRELEIILEKRCQIPASYAKRMVACMSELQKNRKTTTKNVFTLRDLFRWGNRYTNADKKLLDDKLYDWNQHLVEEGYLVLSAKVRTPIEIEIIEETLYKTFKKRIQLNRLFDACSDQESSPVTRDTITAIKEFRKRTDIVWTMNMTRMAVLTAKALQFNEPVLLVGPTGCGKTTVCQILATIRDVQLRILNCHMHTEGADFLGGLRPCRDNAADGDTTARKLFEWSDGPLIHSMMEGSYFMADEISLAEDSVLERLNCVLEPERTVLLSEKGGVAGESDDITKNFVIKAKEGFQFLATMNPGGDFGKKELSPALRNRFTEIWCLPSDSKENLIRIASNCMMDTNKSPTANKEETMKIATYLVEIVLHIRDVVDKFKFSIRDILAWGNYITTNEKLSFAAKAIFGLETVFLDALEMLPHESSEKVESIKKSIMAFAIAEADKILGIRFSAEDVHEERGNTVSMTNDTFGIHPFYLPKNPTNLLNTNNANFRFNAPTTKKNLFRLLSALTLNKPILLEGPPGVGKTSIVESIAQAIGYRIVRINLCEHTDLADLFGTDLPIEDDVFNADDESNVESGNVDASKIGQFAWRDGPLLAALKSEYTWILLDELNLAPQSVLEGLNAILDHRGEVYIPELNKTFELSKQTRIFACQNPLKQGGGRKGLPQSFLNRFNKVYLRKLNTQDLLHVVNGRYAPYFEKLRHTFIEMTKKWLISGDQIHLFDLYKRSCKDTVNIKDNENGPDEGIVEFGFDIVDRLVKFSEILDRGVTAMEFGYKGGPYEINLRDIMRWCDLLQNPDTGFKPTAVSDRKILAMFKYNFERFLLTLYERMKLVYYQRMRCDQDKLFIRKAFADVFECDAEHLHRLSEDVCLYWTDEKIYLNDIVLPRSPKEPYTFRSYMGDDASPLLLSSQREMLKNVVECVHMGKPVLMCGNTDSGKTKIIEAMCTLSGQVCNTDTIDDSVTGSFQQIDLNRHLEEIAERLEYVYLDVIQSLVLNVGYATAEVASIMSKWSAIKAGSIPTLGATNDPQMDIELKLYRYRMKHYKILIEHLESVVANKEGFSKAKPIISELKVRFESLCNRFQRMKTLNAGGSFEWVDSKIVKSLKCGQFISLEHVNICSSAVLDRLNPVFEPDGSLMISEKGVSAQDSAEVVRKSENFRAFLTIDPKNGELSRAMRNRCVELSLNKATYDKDDLRTIIHSHGIYEVNVINTIVRIHEHMEHLTEMNAYNMSHLTQMALLVSSYKRIGYKLSKAIYVSAMEVYVYSASTDLLGYGLSYYQNKLREVVIEEIRHYETESKRQHCTLVDPLKYFSINCNNLNSLAMIELQAAPLILLQNLTDCSTKSMSSILSAFESIEFDTLDRRQLMKFYMYLLYESSTMHDLKLRNEYINQLFSTSYDMITLSDRLFDCVVAFANKFHTKCNKLPWNRKLLPRLRDYPFDRTEAEANEQSEKCSTMLLVKFVMDRLPEESVKTLEHISALSYSRGIAAGLITDKYKNESMKYLYNFVKALHEALPSAIEGNYMNTASHIELTKIGLSFNRLLNVSESRLFNGNQLDSNLIDKILVHFNWLIKLLLVHGSLLSTNPKLVNNIDALLKHIKETEDHRVELKKHYVQNFVHYPPIYEEQQVQVGTLMRKIDRLFCVDSSNGTKIMQKLAAQRLDEAKRFIALAKNQLHNTFDYKFLKNFLDDRYKPEDIPQDLATLLQNFFDDHEEDNSGTSKNPFINCEEFKKYLDVIEKTVLSEEESVDSITRNENSLHGFPLREYYFTKAVTRAIVDPDSIPNMSFCEGIPWLGTESWQLLLFMQTPKYKVFQSLWNKIVKYATELDDPQQFKHFIKYLNNLYSQMVSFDRVLMNAVYVQQVRNLQSHLNYRIINDSAKGTGDCTYHGPKLVNTMIALLFNHDGSMKTVPLKDFDLWHESLKETKELMWLNGDIMTRSYSETLTNFELAFHSARRLLKEYDNVGMKMEYNDNVVDYAEIIEQLDNVIIKCTPLMEPKEMGCYILKNMEFLGSLMNALIGVIELCLMTYTPLIDPVEKNRLKQQYAKDEIEYFTNMLNAYKMMKITMNCNSWGNETTKTIEKHLASANEYLKTFSQKIAVRPKTCMYRQLVQDITHFLRTQCDTTVICATLKTAQVEWLKLMKREQPLRGNEKTFTQMMGKLKNWSDNAHSFLCGMLDKYASYMDIMQPIEYAVNRACFGMDGLRNIMGSMQSFASREHDIILSFLKFPATGLYIDNSAMTRSKNVTDTLLIAEELPNSEHIKFQLLKSNLLDLRNIIAIRGVVENDLFKEFDFLLNGCANIWQKEEDRRRQMQAEEESLYVSKKKCENEDEEMQELEEIAEYFPTNVEEDFGEFLVENTLEKVMRLDKKKDLKAKNPQLLKPEDYGFWAKNFIVVMEELTITSYYNHKVLKKRQPSDLKIVEAFQQRLQTAVQVYCKSKVIMNDQLDTESYAAFLTALSLQRQSLGGSVDKNTYNFYKDSNITEVRSCLDVLNRIEARVSEQLDLYPEHASLVDINRVIKRIRHLPSTAPVVRFNSGFQILRQKITQWNEVAHRNNNLQAEEFEVAEFVQKWTKLELQFWRNCLNQTSEKIETKAYKYWFFIYNLLREYINNQELDPSLTNMKYTEKRFANEEFLDPSEMQNKSGRSVIAAQEIVHILRQFIEASNYGDFHIRLQLLHAFQLYLNHKHFSTPLAGHKCSDLIAGLRHIHNYYSQFADEIGETQRNMRTPIEKKLREFVKIESYSKDLSYFSMRNNVARVHRNLNKFLKEYSQQLEQKITPVFQPNDATVKDYNVTSSKGKCMRFESNVKYNMVDAKFFVASEKLRSLYAMEINFEDSAATALLPTVGRLFDTSRNIVKETLTHAQYPKFTIALDVLFSEQLERCEHLRSLQVDRTKERRHQVAEAKQILQQKRKGLTDLFKILKQLGMNFRKGLMEISLGTEIDECGVPPFCVKTMLNALKDKHIHGNLLQLNENLDKYFAKCVFKLRLLHNIMLAPLSELGPSNIDRIKGFAVHFFLEVQEQRKYLANSVLEVAQLLKYLEILRDLSSTVDNEEDNFEFSKNAFQFKQAQRILTHVRFIYEQFSVFLDCAPSEHHEHNQVLNKTSAFIKNSPLYGKIVQTSHTIQHLTKTTLAAMETTDSDFISDAKSNEFKEACYKCMELTRELVVDFNTCGNDNHPIIKPLNELLVGFQTDSFNKESTHQQSCSNDRELEDALKCVLLAIQKLFKKHKPNAFSETPTRTSETKDGSGNLCEEDNIQDHHLTKKISDDLKTDWNTLNISYVLNCICSSLQSLWLSKVSLVRRCFIKKMISMLPILEQYHLLCEYFLLQKLASHKVSVKMLSVLLTVFVEIGSKGFCVPADLMQEEEGQATNEQKEGEGFGLEDGTGDKDASDKIESEDQLDDAKRPEDRKDEDNKEQDDCKEEKGIEMSDDFEGKMQDIEKPEEDDSAESEDDEEDLNKEMGETDPGADKLDDQIWGDDDEPEEEEDDDEQELNEEDDGKGSKDEKDSHNDLDANNDAAKEQGTEDDKKEGLDATDENQDDKKKKKQEKDIDDMKDQEMDEEQTNAMHNELEEPPEPEEMDLGDMNNVDEGQDADDQQDGDNPFDIDSMKENMQTPEEVEEAGDEKPEETKEGDDAADSDSSAEEDDDKLCSKDPEENEKPDDDAEDDVDNTEEPETQKRGEVEEEPNADDDKEDPQEEPRDEKPEEFQPSKDHASKEENVQSIPDNNDKATADQVQNEQNADEVKQDQKMDEQETGEEKDGVGQADNDVDDQGHQGIADTKETVSNEERQQERKTQDKRKQGRTNEERSLGEAEQNKLKQLKTIDKLGEKNKANDDKDDDKETEGAEEYQHVKEPQASDKTTLDNATEEQAKKIHHEDDHKDDDVEQDGETNLDLMEEESSNEPQPDDENLEEMGAEKFEQKSDKPSKSKKQDQELETEEKMEVEGEVVPTMNVPRSDDTSAHCNKDILLESANQAQEMSVAETLEMRKLVHHQLTTNKTNLALPEDCENWQTISNRMAPNARELCEQLRLILEPTKCTRLKGDYRTGRRINMKKIIPYIASQFRKDKIWLRRTKPAQRDYKITIAIDDSKSMHHNNSKILTLEAISLISQALTLLESGRLSIMSFGESPQIILNHTDQFDGPKLVNSLNFEQGKTKIAELLDFIRVANAEEGSSGSNNGLFENLLLVLSDGRNIFSEGKAKVKNAIKLARLQRIFLVYVIIDNPDNKSSILDIQSVESLPDKSVTIKSYLDDFPFPYYVIVRDLNQLPMVLSEAMRQWFELVNSEE